MLNILNTTIRLPSRCLTRQRGPRTRESGIRYCSEQSKNSRSSVLSSQSKRQLLSWLITEGIACIRGLVKVGVSRSRVALHEAPTAAGPVLHLGFLLQVTEIVSRRSSSTGVALVVRYVLDMEMCLRLSRILSRIHRNRTQL